MPTTAPALVPTATDPRDTDPRPTPEPPAPQPPDLAACDSCITTTPADDLALTLAGSRICPNCQHDHYWQCPDCGGWNPDGYTCGNYCDDSDDEDDDDDGGQDDGGGLIHDYGFKPDPVFHGTGPLFLGLELELATPDSLWTPACLAVQALDGLGYLKADDSIGRGFELVTHPMTYPWALTHFPWHLLPDLAAAGARATDRCGLHVHVSRAGFISPAHVYRWMTFIHRNQSPVTALARRESDAWARFDDDERGRVKDYAKGAHGLHRYQAINTQNTDTFELRIFASTLQPLHVQAALGFAAATVDYTRTLTVPAITRDGGWTWPAFTSWLGGRPEYAPLLDQVQVLTAGARPCAC